MWLIILIILLIIAIIIEKKLIPEEKKDEIINNNIDLSNYKSNGYIMTQTELIFYRELKKVTDKLEMSIFPQINLERLVKVLNNNAKDRNRIKSRSIDFSIVSNKNCKVICCIELDDKTHYKKKAIIADNFKNNLFEQVKIPLYRVKVNNYYNLESLEKMIKESNKPSSLTTTEHNS